MLAYSLSRPRRLGPETRAGALRDSSGVKPAPKLCSQNGARFAFAKSSHPARSCADARLIKDDGAEGTLHLRRMIVHRFNPALPGTSARLSQHQALLAFQGKSLCAYLDDLAAYPKPRRTRFSWGLVLARLAAPGESRESPIRTSAARKFAKPPRIC